MCCIFHCIADFAVQHLCPDVAWLDKEQSEQAIMGPIKGMLMKGPLICCHICVGCTLIAALWYMLSCVKDVAHQGWLVMAESHWFILPDLCDVHVLDCIHHNKLLL